MPCTRRGAQSSVPFFAVEEKLPLLLALIMGLQHCFSMVGGIVTPALVLYNTAVPSDSPDYDVSTLQYMVFASLIVSGLTSMIQVLQLKIPTPWGPLVVGTGLISVMGTSFTYIPIALASISLQFEDGATFSQAYGRFLGTAALCTLLELFMSFMPASALRKLFPPIVSGTTVFLIGANLTGTGLKYWGGGTACAADSTLACGNNGDTDLPFGSAPYIGLGLLVYTALVLIELFGSPFLRNTSVVWALLTGYLVASVTSYDGRSYVSTVNIDQAPAITFLWTQTFPLGVHFPAVLPLLIAVVVTSVESIGDITASELASNLPTDGPPHEQRIRGGLRGDAINSIIACLAGATPNTTYSQNNGVIALTRVASRWAGVSAAGWLVLCGVLAKVGAFFTTIPDCVLGGITTFLFSNVLVSGVRILAMTRLGRRERFILAMALGVGLGVTIVPHWPSRLWPETPEMSATVRGLRDGVLIVLSTGYCIGSIVAALLNAVLPHEEDDGSEGGASEHGGVTSPAVSDAIAAKEEASSLAELREPADLLAVGRDEHGAPVEPSGSSSRLDEVLLT